MKEILTIIALVSLGLCLLCSLTKAVMKKGDKGAKHCDKACGAFVFLAIVLLAVSQLLGETEKYSSIPMSSKFGYCAMRNANTPLCGPPGPGSAPQRQPPPLCYPTPSHGAIDPYITTLNKCNSDKDCNVNGYFSNSDAPTCSKCSNGKCGVYGYINEVKKKVYIGGPLRECKPDKDGTCLVPGCYNCPGPSPTKASSTA